MNSKTDELTGLTVIFREKINKSYEKIITIIKDGTTYIAELNYDDWDGYSINWADKNSQSVEEPAWATEYAETNSYYDLAYLLDEMAVEK
jgi:hypothetical protein